MIRILIGILAVISLMAGLVWYLRQPGADPFQAGVLVRVGTILAVISLAYPQLLALRHRVPTMMIGLGAVIIFLVAARGTQGRIIVALIVFSVSVAGALKWLSKLADQDPGKR